MNEFFATPAGTLHQVLTNRLLQMVTTLTSGSSAGAFDNIPSLIDDSLGNITQILPLTGFNNVEDVELLANDIESAHPIGPANVWHEMSGIFYELALNGVQHAESAAGCYVVLECTTVAPGAIIYAVGVADCGIGIPASLRKNPDYAHIMDDMKAIIRATELHVTGTGDATRGLGLDHIMKVVKGFQGNFAIISGAGCLNILNGLTVIEADDRPADCLSGTVAVITLSV